MKALHSMGCEVNHVSQNGFRENDFMSCDFQVLYGMRLNGKEIIESYLKKGIQTIVIDLGYIDRAMKSNGYDGYWQVSLNGLNWMPDNADDKRFKWDYPKPVKRDGYVLLCEQTPNDSSHGMDIDALNAWMNKAVKRCEELGLKYKKRRHPMNTDIPKEDLPITPIEDDLKGASCVYVHNSNAGNDALMMGLPVVCDESPRYKPSYYDLVSKDLSNIFYPDGIEDYLNRLAYGQWTRNEIETGKAFEYVLTQM
jgi:hypothetical protein